MHTNTDTTIPKQWAPPFFTIWTGQAFSLFGSQLVQFALIWWLTQETGSATVLAMASLAGMLPQVILGPIAGALVDRWNRRLVMMLADSTIAAATLLLMLLFYTGRVEIWHIYALMFLRSAAGGFHWPAMQASTSLMVPKQHLSRIQGLNQMLQGGISIGSAPIAALLLTIFPMEGILMIDIGTAMIAVFPLFFINIPQPPEPEIAEGESPIQTSVWYDIIAGFRYIWNWKGMLIILVLATAINLLLAPATALLPILVTEHFHGAAMQLAYLESAWGIGVVAGGLLLGIWGGFQRKILTTLGGVVITGIGMAVLGIIPPSGFWLAVAVLLIAGVADSLIYGPIMALVQSIVTPNMQGRVFTLMASSSIAATPIGLLIAGPLADRFGVQVWFLIGGAVTALIGIGGFFIPKVLHIEETQNDEVPVIPSS